MPSALRTFSLAATAIGLSFGTLAAVGEIACRLVFPDRQLRFQVDPALIARVMPSQRAFIRLLDGTPSAFATVNGHGFRGPERPPEARRSLLLLGDSFTFGTGVEDEETFAARLDAALGPETHVWNGGQPGYGIWQMGLTLDRVADVLRPDRVVAVLWQGDFLRQPPSDSEKEAMLRASRTMKVLKRSVLLTHLVRLWERAALRLGFEGAVVHIGETRVPSPEVAIETHRRGFQADAPRIRAIHRRSLEVGSGLALVLWPKEDFANRFEPGLADMLTAEVRAFADAEGIPFTSLQQAMATAEPDDLLIPGDWHPTPLSHCLAAEHIAEALAALGEEIAEPVRCDPLR